jgi:hypothetical protein
METHLYVGIAVPAHEYEMTMKDELDEDPELSELAQDCNSRLQRSLCPGGGCSMTSKLRADYDDNTHRVVMGIQIRSHLGEIQTTTLEKSRAQFRMEREHLAMTQPSLYRLLESSPVGLIMVSHLR